MSPQALQVETTGMPSTTKTEAATRMRALLQPAYGSPDVLSIGETAVPKPSAGEVRVRVRCVSLAAGDLHLLTGTPYLVRLAGYGLLQPKNPVPGMAIAGVIEAVGSQARRFRVGDEVFGEVDRGGLAELALAPETNLARKPANLSFEQAACAPDSGVTALQALRDAGGLQAGQRVLINGASGGVGTFAIQLAKAMGAEVIAVCSARNSQQARALGADAVINYEVEDFTRSTRDFDLLLDVIGNHPLAACRRVLRPTGTYVSVGRKHIGNWLDPLCGLVGVQLASLLGKQKMTSQLPNKSSADLDVLAEFLASGAVKPVIERRFGFGEAPKAFRVLAEGHAQGKTVITI